MLLFSLGQTIKLSRPRRRKPLSRGGKMTTIALSGQALAVVAGRPSERLGLSGLRTWEPFNMLIALATEVDDTFAA